MDISFYGMGVEPVPFFFVPYECGALFCGVFSLIFSL